MKAVVFLFITTLLLAGCLGGGQTTDNPADGNQTTNQSNEANITPSFTISSPSDNQEFEIAAGESTVDVQLVLTTSSLIINPQLSGNNYGEGHFSVKVDDGEPLLIFKKQHTLSNVPEGTHILSVEFVNNDHSSYIPAIRESITIIVLNPHKFDPRTYDISIERSSFTPSQITINAGDRVVWTNNLNLPRSVTSTGNFDSGILATGEMFEYIFNEPGTYTYHSKFTDGGNPGPGTIVVLER